MVKELTLIDKEHSPEGITVVDKDDIVLKEELVQDVESGETNAAPSVAAVKAVKDSSVQLSDIVNDLTSGGTDKALSAEQGKVLDGKKVDKLTDSADLVYVHGADGTEQGKALSEFVVDADIVNDRTTGGVDKVLAAEIGKDTCFIFNIDLPLLSAGGKTAATVNNAKLIDTALSPTNVYIHPDEIPEDVKQKIRRNDLVVFSTLFWGFARFSRLGLASDTRVNSATNIVINTSLPDAGNWEGWYMFDMLNHGHDRLKTQAKTNTYITYLFDGDETLETLPDAKGPMPTGGFSYSIVYIKPEDIKANRLTTGIPSTYLKQVDGSVIKPGDILCIETPASAEATKKIRIIHCLISHTAASTNKLLGSNTMNTKLPAAGNWGGWLVGRILSSGWDREALLSKTDSTKVQHYQLSIPTTGKTFASMPNLTGFNSNQGISFSYFYVHPDDLGDVRNTLKKGDTVSFGRVDDADAGKAVGHINAVFHAVETVATVDKKVIINETIPDTGNFIGWYAFFILSSAYDRVQMANKSDFWVMTSTDDNSNLPYGLLSLRPITFANGKDTDSFYNKIKPGDLIRVNRNGIFDYVLQFTGFAGGAVNNTLVGFDQAPADMDGFLCCHVVASLYDHGYRNMLTTTRYTATQFEVGKKYKISVKPVGTDTVRVGGVDIREVQADLYRVPISHNYISGDLLRLLVDNQIVIGYIEEATIMADWKITFVCLSKASKDATDLTAGA